MGCGCKQRNDQPNIRPIVEQPKITPVPVLTEDQMDKMTDEEKEQWEKLKKQ